ncbi:sulfide-dependent adenosine diphosphate thiazole synthase [Pyrodictium delaneyi]|uniref:Thiamine thiazole synthase n=1 Tax=Pyrodictium delaneyi TaxID=1273541 RepID=A0A211YNM4_9CREN|nr:sulfide-dependent adenosine diphosphate thiazole synthase [Pyrodictium delaneyi]OWJ54457.1 ribose 1,5-bisphosphate isomerase [Pyrodictium delaneyi]
MPLETKITRTIVTATAEEWAEIANVDVVIVGAGPAGMTAARYLAEKGLRVVVFERRLSFGGGIGGGGMLFHKIVVDEKTVPILEDFRVRYQKRNDLYVVDAAELMAKLAAHAIDAGARIIHGVQVDDVIIRYDPLRVVGVAIQWSAVIMSGLHVDPLFVYSRAVVDATGHDAEVLSVFSRKVPEAELIIPGEKSAYAEEAEKLVVEKTGRVLPGLYVAGMAVAALYNLPRMGPIFAGMLLSGKKIAEIIAEDLRA